MQQQGENADVAGGVEDGEERLEIAAEQGEQAVLRSFGDFGRGSEDSSFGGVRGFDGYHELGFSSDDGVAVRERGGRDALAVEKQSVAAVEVAEVASSVGGFDGEVGAGHVGIVGEGEV